MFTGSEGIGMSEQDPRIDIVQRLFAAWSSGDTDAPQAFFHPDATLYDIVGGEHVGWQNIRAFFAKGLVKWSDLTLIPDGFWTSDTGVAVRWVMSATVREANLFGEEFVGRKWRSEGMSYLDFDGDKIRREVDYHDSMGAARSLGVTVKRYNRD